MSIKCHCKFCWKNFFCQIGKNDELCFYRFALKPNKTDDFGCFNDDVGRFLCNTTDENYRVQCCSTSFCNVPSNFLNQTVEVRRETNSSNLIVFGLVAVLTFSIVIFYGFSCRRNFGRISRRKTVTDLTSIEDRLSLDSEFEQKNLPLEIRRINKEITFLHELGQGRHARVRLALFGKQYRAVKLFQSRNQQEFERERSIFHSDLIEHPNVLAFYGSDFFAKGTDTFHMLVFEWHPNGTLHDFLKENCNQTFFTIEQVFRYTTSLADGLAHLHSIKYGTNDLCKPQMAHCDIKSSNILVKLNGDCCYADFSLAVRCHPENQEILGGGVERFFHRVGTKLYMAPELLEPKSKFEFDRIVAYQQADIYSLSLVFWEICHSFQCKNHQRPYENQLPDSFSVEQLTDLICQEKKRPTLDEFSVSSDRLLVSIVDLLEFYWCDDPRARHSASNLQEKLREIRSAQWNQ